MLLTNTQKVTKLYSNKVKFPKKRNSVEKLQYWPFIQTLRMTFVYIFLISDFSANNDVLFKLQRWKGVIFLNYCKTAQGGDWGGFLTLDTTVHVPSPTSTCHWFL